tara:strand:+ start:215 stop:379 length:165 start_codon:yes stop_codon:yes gene_type:complete
MNATLLDVDFWSKVNVRTFSDPLIYVLALPLIICGIRLSEDALVDGLAENRVLM